WLHVSGHVEWDMAEGGPDRIQRKMVDLHSWGYSAELLPVGDLASLEPDLTPPVGLEAFIYYPNEGYIDPAAFVGLLANRARELGTTIRTGVAVTGLLQERGRVTGVVLASGERIEADTVVACAGIGAPGILEQVGMHLPMLHSVRWAWWR
ncbi:MAG TPA: FAD-dependent oxidoreductase, partial [Thermomicrobiales bacterium]|nr:FAD-dependent oxidoreductase [Thermomicrobiales bacterium]